MINSKPPPIYFKDVENHTAKIQKVQAAAWMFLSTCSIMIYNCNLNFPFYDESNSTMVDIFYFSYLVGPCRYTPSVAPHLRQSHRTFAVMIMNLITNAIWIPSSLLMLGIAIRRSHGKIGVRCHYPWISATILTLLMDLVGTAMYGVDISRTTTLEDFKEYFPYIQVDLAFISGWTFLPSLVMLLFECKAVILDLTNSVLLFIVYRTLPIVKNMTPAAAFVEEIETYTDKHTPEVNVKGMAVKRRTVDPSELRPSSEFLQTMLNSVLPGSIILILLGFFLV